MTTRPGFPEVPQFPMARDLGGALAMPRMEVMDFARACYDAGRAAARESSTIVMDWKAETNDPVAEMDAILKVYEESMGIEPGPEMTRVVRKTRQMLLTWWGWHRETIRAALVAARAPEAAATAPTAAPIVPDSLLHIVQHNEARATPDETRSMTAELERLRLLLKDPVVVHLNMLHGHIAKIEMGLLAHVHGQDMQDRWAAFERWEAGKRKLRPGEPTPPPGPQTAWCDFCGGCYEWGGNGLWHHAGCLKIPAGHGTAWLEAAPKGDSNG